MNSKKIVFSSLILVFLQGCSVAPTKNEIKVANFGPQLTNTEFEEKVRNGLGFKDPYSAVINCSKPRKAGASHGFEKRYGWLAHCTYNAKNGFGGYVGEEKDTIMYSKGDVFLVYSGSWQYYTPSVNYENDINEWEESASDFKRAKVKFAEIKVLSKPSFSGNVVGHPCVST